MSVKKELQGQDRDLRVKRGMLLDTHAPGGLLGSHCRLFGPGVWVAEPIESHQKLTTLAVSACSVSGQRQSSHRWDPCRSRA